MILLYDGNVLKNSWDAEDAIVEQKVKKVIGW